MAEKNSIGFLKEITGNAKIDEKIGEWLRMDKVRVLVEFLCGLFQSTHHSFLYRILIPRCCRCINIHGNSAVFIHPAQF